MFRNHVHAVSNNWRDALKEIKALTDEKAKYGDIFTQYEHQAANEAIREARERYGSTVINGAISEYFGQVNQVKQSRAATTKAKQNEINRWNPATLKAEMDLVAARITQTMQTGGISGGGWSMVGKSGGTGSGAIKVQLEALAAEAKASGDIHKMRAFAEVARGTLAGGAGLKEKDDRYAASFLSTQAEDDLRALRVTPEIQQAIQAEKAAWETLDKMRDDLAETANIMGEPIGAFSSNGIFNQALNCVKVDPDGTPHFYELTDPVIQGFSIKEIVTSPGNESK